MRDDLTTGTTAHSLQQHPMKTQLVSKTTSKTKKKTVLQLFEGMNINIPPPEGQLVTFKNSVQVLSDHRIKWAWATFTSHRQELTSPKITTARRARSLRHRVDIITLLRFRYVDDDGRNEE